MHLYKIIILSISLSNFSLIILIDLIQFYNQFD
jgi:hypothetical protein